MRVGWLSFAALVGVACAGGGAIAVDGGGDGADGGPVDAGRDVLPLDAGDAGDADADASVRCNAEPDAGVELVPLAIDGISAATPFAVGDAEKLLVFARPDDAGKDRLHYAARASLGVPFSSAAPLPLADPGDESRDAWLSDDGDEMLWTRGLAGAYETRLSKRGADGTFDAGERIAIRSVSTPSIGRAVLTDGALYYTEAGVAANTGLRLMRAARVDRTTFDAPVAQTNQDPGPFALTYDERALYVTTRMYEAEALVSVPQMSHRPTSAFPWGVFFDFPRRALGSSAGSVRAQWVSPDDCRVYVSTASAPFVAVLSRGPR